MMLTRLIFNPMAAGGRVARMRSALKERVAQAAQDAGAQLEWVETQAQRHATSLAKEAATDGYDLVVAVGGDGTVNEVVNGLMQAGPQRQPVTLGIVPAGSGNDFAWLAGIPRDPLDACQRLFTGATRRVDVGHIRDAQGRERYFNNGCGFGFDGQVGVEAQRFKWLPGFSLYMVAVLKTLIFHHHSPVLRVYLDGRELRRSTMMTTVSNGRRHGGGFLVTPEAELDDGLFDICLAGPLSRLGMLLILPRFTKGTHVTHRRVQMERARHVRVESPLPQAIHLDGEVFAPDVEAFEIQMLPGALRLRV